MGLWQPTLRALPPELTSLDMSGLSGLSEPVCLSHTAGLSGLSGN